MTTSQASQAAAFQPVADPRTAGYPIVARGTLAKVNGGSGAIKWLLRPVAPGVCNGVTGALYVRRDNGKVIYTGVTDNLATRLNFRVYPGQKRLFANFLPHIGADIDVYAAPARGGSDDPQRAALIATYGSLGNVQPANPDGLATKAAPSASPTPHFDADAYGDRYNDPIRNGDDDDSDAGDIPDAASLAAMLPEVPAPVTEADNAANMAAAAKSVRGKLRSKRAA